MAEMEREAWTRVQTLIHSVREFVKNFVINNDLLRHFKCTYVHFVSHYNI